ncbi:MAG: hypothetical protein KDD39_11425 [Bdellovibrionales bacterium]|nr:hypothetical protein [Bdellovibrionales bacterium]
MKKTLIVTVFSVAMLALGYLLRPSDSPYIGVDSTPVAGAESSAVIPDGTVPSEVDAQPSPSEEAAGEPQEEAEQEAEQED